MKKPIYLDYASTTPVDPRVVKKMMNYLSLGGVFGNSSSTSHYYGWQAAEAVDIARNHIASFIGADPREIIFTSGATESDNLAIKGVAHMYCKKGRHIITSAIEHKAVLDTCKQLEYQGYEVTKLVPRYSGLITLEQLSDVIRDDTILFSLIYVNNETGVVQDIMNLGKICHANGILFHVDATQAVGKIVIDLKSLPVDLMTFNAHKLYGPKGIGCLYIRRNPTIVQIKAQMHGGGHERGIRSGTLPVHQIVAMGEAYRILSEEMDTEVIRLNKLHNYLWDGLQQIEGIVLNSDLKYTVPTILNVSFSNIDGSMLMSSLTDLAVSSGSSCSSFDSSASHVLKALGIKRDLINSTIRFSIGRFTTYEELQYSIDQVSNVVKYLQKIK